MLKGRSLMTLHDLARKGMGYREIARLTGHSRNTVRRYLRDSAGKEQPERQKRGSKLDPYKPMIDKYLEDGLRSAPAIMSRIVPLGYQGKETLIRNYVRSISPLNKEEKIKLRYETKPGDQMQFDWGSFAYTDDYGNEKHIAGLMAILSYSRRRFLIFSHSMDVYGLTTCLIEAFFHFGGLTNVVLTDHMKTVVTGGDEESGYVFNPQIEDLCRYLGVSIKLCRPRRPQTKGKVERSIGYAKSNFWPARKFSDLEDLNTQALSWANACDMQIHPSIGTTPIEAFNNIERHFLSGLPKRAELERFEKRTRKVSLDGFVSFGHASYGVPVKYAGGFVTILPKRSKLYIYDQDGAEIATHDLIFKLRSTAYMENQYSKENSQPLYIPTRKRAHYSDVADIEIRPLSVYEELANV